jgi:2-polyprenyl-3-methyl-5-hydroxy-6-metoxy-1,4-benzoquinol methylase
MNGWDGASFRDRKGRVYHLDGRVLRKLSPAGLENWRTFAKHPLCAELMAEHLLVSTKEVHGEIRGLGPGPFLEHEPVRFVSYSFEWPFSMLKRAALLHLQLMRRLIPAGFILSDATPSNVMFRGTRPVFIDTASVVGYQPGDPWRGFKQFLETMLYPLLLAAHKAIPYHSWLRGSGENGLPVDQVARVFGWFDILRPGVFGHVKVTGAIERLTRERFELSEDETRTAAVPTPLLLRNVTKLERIVEKLETRRVSGVWTDYDDVASYGPDGHQRKRAGVEDAAVRLAGQRSLIWDIGCNTGAYSVLIAKHADSVVAMDQEAAVVEEVYRRANREQVYNILPLVMDVSNPSPAQGWRGRERRSLSERGRPDLIVALALLHHLVLTKNVPIDQVVAELARLGRCCVLEYVAPDDPQALRLARNGGNGRNQLPQRNAFEQIVGEQFRVDGVISLTATRTLYLLEARA